MTQRITFFAPGTPAPQGSKRAFVRGKRAVMVEDNKRTHPWRSVVTMAAATEMKGRQPIDAAIEVDLCFIFARPKSHYRTNGKLKPTAPEWVGTKPDVDKLQRAAFDAMSGVVFVDDARIANVSARKRYVNEIQKSPGLVATVQAINDAATAAGKEA